MNVIPMAHCSNTLNCIFIVLTPPRLTKISILQGRKTIFMGARVSFSVQETRESEKEQTGESFKLWEVAVL